MKRTFKEAIEHRHSYYALSPESPISDEEIQKILETVLESAPSANNSQTTRLVLLLGEDHKKLWNIVRETLRKRIAPERFEKTNEKIEKSFYSGYGTILFFEEGNEVKKLQEKFPNYKDQYLHYSHHTNAIHQFCIWVMLEDAGFGASLQHYNPLIDEEVKSQWGITEGWELIAQMPFGKPLETPEAKEKLLPEKKLRIFR